MRARPSLALALVLTTAPLALASCSDDDDGDGGGRCAVLRPSEAGPGDVANLFPLAPGNRWIYEDRENDAPPQTTEMAATGTRTVDGVLATVLVSEVVGDVGAAPRESLARNGPSGVSVHVEGSRGPGDVYPYDFLRWPLAAGTGFTPYDCVDLPAGGDLDGDGREDRMDMRLDVTVDADEAVTVPAGTFTARRITSRTRIILRGTSGQSLSGSTDETHWYAPGVGPVRGAVSIAGFLGTGSAERALIGYDVGGTRAGL